jgi:hypothetical protein
MRHEAQSSSSRAKHPSPSPPATRVYNDESLRGRLGKHKHRTEASAIVDGYRFAAARERMAFGIPPSDSDEVFKKALGEEGFSHTESEASSLNRTMWQEEESEELSVDAESIFKAMDYKKNEKDIKRDEERQVVFSSVFIHETHVLISELILAHVCERSAIEHHFSDGVICIRRTYSRYYLD